MSKFPPYSEVPCRKWQDDHSTNVRLYGKCCATCMKQVRCKDNPDDFFGETDLTNRKKK